MTADNAEVLLTLLDKVTAHPIENTSELGIVCEAGVEIFQRVQKLREDLATRRAELAMWLKMIPDVVGPTELKVSLHAAGKVSLACLDEALAKLGD